MRRSASHGRPHKINRKLKQSAVFCDIIFARRLNYIMFLERKSNQILGEKVKKEERA